MCLKKYKDQVNNLIDNYLLSIDDLELKDMLKYCLEGGKRLRPIICLCLFENFGITDYNIVIGIEFLHCASLILDDLPCMDNDDYRRNRLTFHKKYGVKKAYLVANYLFTTFNKFILNLQNDKIINYVFDNLIMIVKGQYYDLGFVKNNNISKNDLIFNNNLKTAPFFVLSFTIPFLLLNKFDCIKDIEKCAYFFSNAFQIYDDFMDYEQDLKNKTFNHLILLGKEETYKLYMENIKNFKYLCKKYDISYILFDEIIKYLNDNLITYVNGL
jgi:geranylgeranyl diphosphate synthase, type II